MQIISVEKLEGKMRESGLSARALSLQAGLNTTAVRDILTGRSKATRSHTILRLAEALNCKPELLLNEEAVKVLFESDADLAIRKMKDLQIELGNILYKSDDGKVVLYDHAISTSGDDFDHMLSHVRGDQYSRARGIDFTGANLDNAILRNTKLPGATFTGAFMANADLSGSDLSGAKFDGAIMKFADLRECNLVDANFVGADIEGIRLAGTNLAGADFTGVDLSKVDWG